MIALDMRLQLLALLTEACKAGARWARACALIGLSVRTVQRWQRPQATGGDLRASDQRKPCTPRNQLSEAERLAALELLNSEEFKNLPPSQIVPRLADQGRYVASESTLYRLAVNSPTAAWSARHKSAASHALWQRSSPIRFIAGTSRICPPRCAVPISTCTCLWICSAAK